jgi:hypothetical protein
MYEIVVNLHMHTRYSDGHVSHTDIARAALATGIDAVIVTDHNVYVDGPEDYYHLPGGAGTTPQRGLPEDGGKRVLLLVGEEIHDQARQPQKSPLLAFGHNCELAGRAADIPRLLESIRSAGGVSFIAHPYDPEAPAFNEGDLSWEDWQVQGYTGIELWNAMSEFKSLLKSKLHAIYYALNPESIAQSPFPRVVKIWDDLLAAGQKVVAIGGTDAHALPARLGPLRRTLFPFEFHFKTLNTHLSLSQALSGEIDRDRLLILEAFRRGRAFIGYDLPASTRGFRFIAHGFDQKATMGEDITCERGVTFQVTLPMAAECRLIRHGEVIQTWAHQQHCTYITSRPGAYRVEAYTDFRGKRRAWIFSNPIYVRLK